MRFIKYIPSELSRWLMANKPFAYLLLALIAERARRTDDPLTGLKKGQAFIGDYKSIGATRGQYRHALDFLCQRKIAKVDSTSRQRKKTTTETTTESTIVSLCDSTIWDINILDNNHSNNHSTTTEQPLNNHKQERKKEKNEKKTTTPKPPSFVSSSSDSSSLSLFYACLMKESMESLKPEDKQFFTDHYDEGLLEKVIAHVTSPKFKIKSSLFGSIQHFCEHPDHMKKETDNERIAKKYINQLREMNFFQYARESENKLESGYIYIFQNGQWTTTSIKNVSVLKQDIKDSLEELGSFRNNTSSIQSIKTTSMRV
jgi:hypothetical protein